VLPGPSAAVVAAAGSGFADHGYRFCGFLPVKSGARARALALALADPLPTVFYESPHRLLKSLDALAALDGTRSAVVARELTKKFEEFRRGTPGELAEHYRAHPPRGEICLVISGEPRRREAVSGA